MPTPCCACCRIWLRPWSIPTPPPALSIISTASRRAIRCSRHGAVQGPCILSGNSSPASKPRVGADRSNSFELPCARQRRQSIEQIQQLLTPLIADLRDNPGLVHGLQLGGALQLRSSARRETEGIGAAVGMGFSAPHETALLEISDDRDEIRLLDAERSRHARLTGARVLVDHHQYGELSRPQVEFRQRMVEVRKNDSLRAPQCVAYVAAEWCHFHGSLVRRSRLLFPIRWNALRASPVRDIGSLPTPGRMLPRHKAKNSTQSDIGLAASSIRRFCVAVILIRRLAHRIRPQPKPLLSVWQIAHISRNNWFVELIVTYN